MKKKYISSSTIEREISINLLNYLKESSVINDEMYSYVMNKLINNIKNDITSSNYKLFN